MASPNVTPSNDNPNDREKANYSQRVSAMARSVFQSAFESVRGAAQLPARLCVGPDQPHLCRRTR